MKFAGFLSLTLCLLIALPVIAHDPKTIEKDELKINDKNKKTTKLEKDKVSAEEYYKKGREAYLKFSTKGYLEAIELFDKALKINKKYSLALASRAEAQALLSTNIFTPKNGIKKARLEMQSFENAFISSELTPDLCESHRALSLVYFVQERYEEGLEEAKKAVELNEEDAESYLLLWLNSPDKKILKRDNYKATNYYKALDLNSKLIDRFLDLNSKLSFAYYQLGMANAAQNNYTDAVDYYEEAIKLTPESEDVFISFGVLYNHAEKFSDAIIQFKEALNIDSERPDANFGLGIAYMRRKDSLTAIDYFEKACNVDYNNSCNLLQNIKADTRLRRSNNKPGRNNN